MCSSWGFRRPTRRNRYEQCSSSNQRQRPDGGDRAYSRVNADHRAGNRGFHHKLHDLHGEQHRRRGFHCRKRSDRCFNIHTRADNCGGNSPIPRLCSLQPEISRRCGWINTDRAARDGGLAVNHKQGAPIMPGKLPVFFPGAKNPVNGKATDPGSRSKTQRPECVPCCRNMRML